MNPLDLTHDLIYVLGAFMACVTLVQTCFRGTMERYFWLRAFVGAVLLIVSSLIAVTLIIALVIGVLNGLI